MSISYYVYILMDPSDFYKPFYVGKGSGDRISVHLRGGSKDNPFKNNKIAKIRAKGHEPVSMKWADGLLEKDAYEMEAYLIKRFGRRNIDEGGILTNICADARPPSSAGRTVSEETRNKIANKQIGDRNHRFGKTWSDEEKEYRSLVSLEKGLRPPVRFGPMPEEQKRKISESNKGRKWSDESRARASEARKGKKRGPPSPETIEKIRSSNTGIKKRKMTDQEREVHSERVRLYWERLTPEQRKSRGKKKAADPKTDHPQ